MLNCNKEVASAPILEDDASLEGKSAAEHAIKEEHRKGLYFGVAPTLFLVIFIVLYLLIGRGSNVMVTCIGLVMSQAGVSRHFAEGHVVQSGQLNRNSKMIKSWLFRTL